LSQKELQRVAVISSCIKGDLTCARAAELLDLTARQIKRGRDIASVAGRGRGFPACGVVIVCEHIQEPHCLLRVSVLLSPRNVHCPNHLRINTLSPAGWLVS
jgi:hypothetical protein